MPVRLIGATPADVGRAEELDFGTRRERVADGGQDTIGSAAGQFGDDVAGIVDIVHVVAAEALHRVGAAAAVDHVGAGIACDRLGNGIAGQIDRAETGGIGRGKGFDRLSGRQSVADVCEDRVGAFACSLEDLVRPIVDVIGVVVRAAMHFIGAAAAIERVVACVAIEHIDTSGVPEQRSAQLVPFEVFDAGNHVTGGIAEETGAGIEVDGHTGHRAPVHQFVDARATIDGVRAARRP